MAFHKKISWNMVVIFCMCILSFIGCDRDAPPPSPVTGTVTDIEGNIYQTIKIGNQWWMSENLKVTRFHSGESINSITDKDQWQSATSPAYTQHINQSAPGLLYNFHVITSGKNIAPEGWRVPTDEDWKLLEEFAGMPVAELDKYNWRGLAEGDKLKVKSTNTSGWIQYESVWGNNETGFSAEGGSCRVFNGEWGFPGLWHSGFWWSSTSHEGYGYYRYLDYKKSGIFRFIAHPNYGFSIRCVKN